MSVLSVGSGQQFSTIAQAVAASSSGDTIDVAAGTYTNDFVVDSDKSLTLNAVGGVVTMNATMQPPNGKAILTEGAVGVTLIIKGFVFENASVPDGNGAGIRYEGGTLNITDSGFFNNQNGILAGADPNGVIIIDHSEFGGNGVGGDGHTHNLYIGTINSFSLTNSYSHDANVGHEVKSRAATNTIEGNVIADNSSSSSYEIDLPNGGAAVIANNVIEQGANSQNSNIIAIGEEGASNPIGAISIVGNTIINDLGKGPALWNATGTTADFSANSVYGFGGNALVNGPANQTGTTVLSSRPSFADAVPSTTTNTTTTPAPNIEQPAPSAAVINPPAPSPTSGLVLSISEDAYQGDAEFTISVDGQQLGGVYAATAAHADGATAQVVVGPLPQGQHQIGVTFINDKWDGTPQTDRNLYVDGVTYDGQSIGSSLALMSAGEQDVTVYGPAAVTTTVTDPTLSALSSAVVVPSGGDAGHAVTSNAVLNISEDAYEGDAQFTISVDGQQYGGV